MIAKDIEMIQDRRNIQSVKRFAKIYKDDDGQDGRFWISRLLLDAESRWFKRCLTRKEWLGIEKRIKFSFEKGSLYLQWLDIELPFQSWTDPIWYASRIPFLVSRNDMQPWHDSESKGRIQSSRTSIADKRNLLYCIFLSRDQTAVYLYFSATMNKAAWWDIVPLPFQSDSKGSKSGQSLWWIRHSTHFVCRPSRLFWCI